MFLYFDTFHFLCNFGDPHNEYLDNERIMRDSPIFIECQVCMG